jgi:hypothetical protein
MNSDYVKELYSTANDNLIANACLSTNIKRLFINHKNIERINHIFSKEINTMKIINQKNTGTCWICSGITICRNILRKNMKTKDDFNLSINHYMFWDKMEKANNFIDYIISNNKLGLENEKIIDKIQDPISDGGYWYMFADLVNKYGIVPESVNTRGYNGTNTTVVNELISYKLREFALQIMENDNHEYEELKKECADKIKIHHDTIEIKHMYIEKKMIPLDLYLKTASLQEADDAIADYGRAIKDMAAVNIFPGDMLLKNFGLTRLNRVVFYDYDEIVFLTDCVFRKIPEARNYEDEWASEPWYSVGENDIFPEEFSKFLIGRADVRKMFLDKHADLYDVKYWQDVQDRLRKGEIVTVFPYRKRLRFKNQFGKGILDGTAQKALDEKETEWPENK